MLFGFYLEYVRLPGRQGWKPGTSFNIRTHRERNNSENNLRYLNVPACLTVGRIGNRTFLSYPLMGKASGFQPVATSHIHPLLNHTNLPIHQFTSSLTLTPYSILPTPYSILPTPYCPSILLSHCPSASPLLFTLPLPHSHSPASSFRPNRFY
jgi:hypothetical protein